MRCIFNTFIFLLFCVIPLRSHAQAEYENPLSCFTCERDCERYGVLPGERVCVGPDSLAMELPRGSYAFEDDVAPLPQLDEVPGRTAEPDVGFVSWMYSVEVIPIQATGFIDSENAHEILAPYFDALVDCYSPEAHDARNSLRVNFYVAYTGQVQGLHADSTGVAPTQARCMLEQLWQVEFPVEQENARTSVLQVELRFALRRTVHGPVDTSQPHILVENVRTHPPLEQSALISALTPYAPSFQRCVLSTGGSLHDQPPLQLYFRVELQEQQNLHHVTSIDIATQGLYTDASMHQAVARCMEREMRQWRLILSPDSPDNVELLYTVYVYPATDSTSGMD